MFYELIYTRCRLGIDILKKGQQITSDGYKVYSCAPAVMEEGKTDLQFLYNAAQAKQSFTDPGFMDDAYLYYTADTGVNFLVNFFPVPFDANAKGDYAKRPGNFVNHAVIGDFSANYPYEFFRDEKVWTAKTKGEAYYYENPPAAEGLPVRDEINNPQGQYSFEEIGSFIKDGREEALKKAVSFLIFQYNEEPKKRKFLVIKEESSKNIELWIAAIECSFSPKIASRIPFATRMDKFTTANKYTTKNGFFQTQINLQDPNHIHRYRAMIVGVHEQDKANTGLARPLASSPFVVLDGKQKKAEFEADISNPYFNYIVRFDDAHRKFCRNKLQVFEINEPGAGVLDIFEALSVLFKPDLPGACRVQEVLVKLSKYKTSSANTLKTIYEKINANLSGFLNEDLSAGLKIITWLMDASKILGDNSAKQSLTSVICGSFANLLFSKSDNTAKKTNWELLKNSDFSLDIVRNITDLGAFEKNIDKINEFDSEEIKTLILIYLEAASKTGNINERIMDFLLRVSIIRAAKNNDIKYFYEIVQIVSKSLNKDIREFQFSLLTHEKIDNEEHQKFVASYIIEQENVKKPADAEKFIKELQKLHLEKTEHNQLAQIFDILREKCGKKAFAECVLRMKFSKEEQSVILNALSFASEDVFLEYVKELVLSAKKYMEIWNFLINFISQDNGKEYEKIIIKALADTKQNEKDIEKLCDLLKDKNDQKYFAEIAKQTPETIKGK